MVDVCVSNSWWGLDYEAQFCRFAGFSFQLNSATAQLFDVNISGRLVEIKTCTLCDLQVKKAIVVEASVSASTLVP